MMRRGGQDMKATVAKGEWTILHRHDPIMDLHLSLMAEAADEALRSLRANDERAASRHKRPVLA